MQKPAFVDPWWFLWLNSWWAGDAQSRLGVVQAEKPLAAPPRDHCQTPVGTEKCGHTEFIATQLAHNR
jgi:hypothetical protein